MKNSFLFVAYQFPPMGGPGVQRSYNFVKELSNQGYSPIVLTIRESEIDAANYQKDWSLIDQIPKGINRLRSKFYFGKAFNEMESVPLILVFLLSFFLGKNGELAICSLQAR